MFAISVKVEGRPTGSVTQTMSLSTHTELGRNPGPGGFSRGHLGAEIFIVLLCVPIGEGSGTPLQYSCLENPMDGGAC